MPSIQLSLALGASTLFTQVRGNLAIIGVTYGWSKTGGKLDANFPIGGEEQRHYSSQQCHRDATEQCSVDGGGECTLDQALDPRCAGPADLCRRLAANSAFGEGGGDLLRDPRRQVGPGEGILDVRHKLALQHGSDHRHAQLEPDEERGVGDARRYAGLRGRYVSQRGADGGRFQCAESRPSDRQRRDEELPAGLRREVRYPEDAYR